MHSKSIIKQIIDFNKMTFDNSFIAFSVLQTHTETMVQMFLDKAHFFPKEGKNVITDWVFTYKKGLQEYKTALDKKFKTIESYFLSANEALESNFNRPSISEEKASVKITRAITKREKSGKNRFIDRKTVNNKDKAKSKVRKKIKQ